MAGVERTESGQTANAAGAECGEGVRSREPVTLVKGSHRWTFTCDPGDEPALLKTLTEMAGDERTPFDWFDAALVSHQLSKRLRAGLNRKK